MVRASQQAEASFAAQDAETWRQWWDALKQEPALQDLVTEREQRFTWRAASNWHNPIYDFQVAALQEAGFREVSTIWQHFGNRVLMAVR